VDHTDGFVNGRTPIPVKTTSAGCRGPAAAPGVEMSCRHLLSVTIKYGFLLILGNLSLPEGRRSRRSRVSAHGCRGRNPCRPGARRPRSAAASGAAGVDGGRAGTVFPLARDVVATRARSRRFASARLLLDVVGRRSNDYRTMPSAKTAAAAIRDGSAAAVVEQLGRAVIAGA
jgi:hypothetical protein